MLSSITAPTYLPTNSAHPLWPGLPTLQDSVNLTRVEVATSPAASEASSPLATASRRSVRAGGKSEAPDAGPRLPQPRGPEVSRWRVALNPQRRIASMRSDAPDRVLP